MTVTLAYEPAIGRVAISANGLGSAAAVIIERSTDQIRWTRVRGAQSIAVTGGAFAYPFYDYEYGPGVRTYYRVRATGTGSLPIQYVGVGAPSSGSSGSRSPAYPAGVQIGDLLLLLASTRNTAGYPSAPLGGWVWLHGYSCLRLYVKIHDGSPPPTVTYTGDTANETTLAQISAFRNAGLQSPVLNVNSLTVGSTNIPFFGIPDPLPEAGMMVLFAGWRGSTWTDCPPIATVTTEISELPSALGNSAGQVWNYYLPPTTVPINTGSFFPNGGAPADTRSLVVALRRSVVEQSASIVPPQDGVWLKSIARPFLNRVVDVRMASTVSVARRARSGLFPVVGRSLPVVVSSVRGSREWTMLIRTSTVEDGEEMDLLLASGDVLLVQAPVETGITSGYVTVADVTRDRHPLRPWSSLFTLPLTEVAAPGPDVAGRAGSWQTLVNSAANWSQVVGQYATWADVLLVVANPSEVIVP